jgi:hypothetical protein
MNMAALWDVAPCSLVEFINISMVSDASIFRVEKQAEHRKKR